MDAMAVMMIFAIIIYTGQAESDYNFSGYKNPRSSLPGIIFFPSLFHTFFLSPFWINYVNFSFCFQEKVGIFHLK